MLEETTRTTTPLVLIVVGLWAAVAGTASFPLEATVDPRRRAGVLPAFIGRGEINYHLILVSLLLGLVLGCTCSPSVVGTCSLPSHA
jgi:hypothetical protein